MLLLQVLNSISKPPGSAPPFIPFKPVPRLVPLPSKHTLPEQQPNRFKLSNFGHLREENLQMILLARRITQQLVDIRQALLTLLFSLPLRHHACSSHIELLWHSGIIQPILASLHFSIQIPCKAFFWLYSSIHVLCKLFLHCCQTATRQFLSCEDCGAQVSSKLCYLCLAFRVALRSTGTSLSSCLGLQVCPLT